MPAQLNGLTQLELELVVFHERIVQGGDDPNTPENLSWIESIREKIGEGDESRIDLDLLLSCADPTMTPDATGDDIGGEDCPGGGAGAGSEETAAGG